MKDKHEKEIDARVEKIKLLEEALNSKSSVDDQLTSSLSKLSDMKAEIGVLTTEREVAIVKTKLTEQSNMAEKDKYHLS